MAFSFCLGAPPSPSAGRPPFGLQNEANLLPPVGDQRAPHTKSAVNQSRRGSAIGSVTGRQEDHDLFGDNRGGTKDRYGVNESGIRYGDCGCLAASDDVRADCRHAMETKTKI